eukprot:scpid19038/ scgid0003/ Epidermal growth factor receptor; Drosophila relative of ERBB; Gurken receptor; Protein torpedo
MTVERGMFPGSRRISSSGARCFLLFFCLNCALVATSTARKVCPGTGNQRLSYNVLRARFEGCESVQGSLDLIRLERANVTENRTYDFLSSIREISGYLRVTLGPAESIPLGNLAVIRGEELYAAGGYALFVSSLPSLTTIDLSSLGDILTGNIGFFSAPALCFVRTSVMWNDIVKNDQSRVVSLAGAGGSASSCGSCNAQCSGSCWDTSNSTCQKLTYLSCQSCGNRRCVSSNPQICCHSECVGGCTGPANSQCLACKNYNSDGSCVALCPPLTILDPRTFSEVVNPKGRYAYRHECVTSCPSSLLVEGQFCVDRCSSGRQVQSGVCVPCNGPCPKRCNGTANDPASSTKYLTKANSRTFENCTEVDGSILITVESVLVSGITAVDLQYLSSIRVISGCLRVDNLNIVEDISFLSQLKTIMGLFPQDCRLGSADYGLVVLRNANLTSVGLSSLRLVNRPAVVRMNPRLCYAQTIDWTSIVPAGQGATVSTGNANATTCEVLGYTCHAQCNTTFGCWGPSPADCLRCSGFRFEGVCRTTCDTTRPTYGEVTQNECLPCHPQCLDSCTGPLPSQCSRCRQFTDNNVCVERCPANTYGDSAGLCQTCPGVCRGGCSGPGLYLGQGGCNDCEQVIRPVTLADGSVDGTPTCLDAASQCPATTYQTSPNRVDDPYFGKLVCEHCHPQCSVCTGPAATECSSCVNARLVSGSRAECLATCPASYYKDVTTGICESCSSQCDPDYSCRGPLASDCERCQSFNQTMPNVTTTAMSSTSVPGQMQSAGFECVSQCRLEQFILSTNQSQICVAQCPRDNFAGSSRTCQPCHSLCSPLHGCKGPLARQCTRCKYVELNDQCLRTCPSGYLVRNASSPDTALAPQQCLRQVNDTDTGGNDPTAEESLIGPGIGAGIGCLIAVALALVLLVLGQRRYQRWKKQRAEKAMELQARDNPVYGGGDGDDEMGMTLQPAPAKKAPTRGVLNLIPRPCLEIGEQLGSGAYGVVYQGTWTEDGVQTSDVAIKVLNSAAASNAHKELLDESAVMSSLEHQNLIRLLGICMEPSIMMVSELAPLGSLLGFLRVRKETLYGHNLLLYCQQISDGMHYLEEQSVVHCDLAARNVLVEHPNLVKLTDFGLARLLDVGQKEIAAEATQKLPIKWLAPETILQKKFTHASDVWSFGITAWEVLTFGNSPYRRIPLHGVLPLLESGERLPQPTAASDSLYKLMKECWLLHATNRPSFLDIRQQLAKMRMTPMDFVQTKADKLAQGAGQAGTEGIYNEPDFDLTQEDLAQYDDDGYMDPSTEADYDNAARRTPGPVSDGDEDDTTAEYDNTQAIAPVEAEYDNTQAAAAPPIAEYDNVAGAGSPDEVGYQEPFKTPPQTAGRGGGGGGG